MGDEASDNDLTSLVDGTIAEDLSVTEDIAKTSDDGDSGEDDEASEEENEPTDTFHLTHHPNSFIDEIDTKPEVIIEDGIIQCPKNHPLYGVVTDPMDPRHPEYWDSEKWWTSMRYMVRKAAYISRRHIIVYRLHDQNHRHCYDNSYLRFYRWDDRLKLWRPVKGYKWENATTTAILFIIKLLAEQIEHETTFCPNIKHYSNRKTVIRLQYVFVSLFMKLELERIIEWSREIQFNSNETLVPLKNGEVFNLISKNHRDRIFSDYFSSELRSSDFITLEEANKLYNPNQIKRKDAQILDVYDISNNAIINRTGSFAMSSRSQSNIRLSKTISESELTRSDSVTNGDSVK